MARFTTTDADNYGGQSGGGFFSLKGHKDTARVRFMYNDINDVEGHSVHEVEIDGKKRYVNCLREYNQPVDDCPFCAAKMKVYAKFFIPLYNIDSDEVQIWDRGKNFGAKLSSLCARYNPLVSYEFEIERNGHAGDTKTTYETFAGENDGTTLEDLPELPLILGGLVLDKSYEDMNCYLDNGFFEDTEETQPEPEPQRRPAGRQSTGRQQTAPSRQAPAGRQPAQPQRRTPANQRPQTRDRF